MFLCSRSNKNEKKKYKKNVHAANDPKTSCGSSRLHRKLKKCSDLFDRLIESEMKNLELY